MEKNLYELDDLLLRLGRVGFGLLLFLAVCAAAVTLAEGGEAGARELAGRMALPFGLALAVSVALMHVGGRIRKKEKRVLQIWKILRRDVEVSVDELVANSHFELAHLQEAVKLLNTKGLAHYVFDPKTRVVQDARLRTMQMHVEKCDVCGGSVSLEVPVGFRRVPSCPYCGDPVCIDSLDARRQEAIAELRAEATPPRSLEGPRVPFSIPIFALLFLCFWPAGVAYAWYKCRQAGVSIG